MENALEQVELSKESLFFFLLETIPVKIRVQFTCFHKVSLFPGYSWAYLYGHFEFGNINTWFSLRAKS